MFYQEWLWLLSSLLVSYFCSNITLHQCQSENGTLQFTLCVLSHTVNYCARQHICYSAYMLSQFCLAVCLAVWPSVWPSVRHTGGLYKNGLSQDHETYITGSPMTLVFPCRTAPRNSKGKIGSVAPNWTGVRKIANFQPISRRISETVQDRTIVTINH